MNIKEERLQEMSSIYGLSKVEILEYLKLITICFEERGLSNPTQEDYEICLDQICNADKLHRKPDTKIDKKYIVDTEVASYIKNGHQQSEITYRDLELLSKYFSSKSSKTSEEPNIPGKK